MQEEANKVLVIIQLAADDGRGHGDVSDGSPYIVSQSFHCCCSRSSYSEFAKSNSNICQSE